MNWGLSDQGFQRPSDTELLDAIEYKARELFGSKANLTVRSPLGIFLRIFAWIFSIIFMVTEDVYNSRFIDTAAGASLYNCGRAIGLRVLPAQKASGYLLVSGVAGTQVPEGFLAATAEGIQYAVMASGKLGEDGTALVPIRALNAGPDGNAPPQSIREIVYPPADGSIQSVVNPSVVDGGQKRETDERFRDRYYQSVDYAGGVNTDAIRGELLQNVEGIYSAIVYENDSDEADQRGLPPHSIEVICYGGLDELIAKAIFRRKSGGIQSVGSIAVPVQTASGQLADIRFSRPSPVSVWVKIGELKTDASFPEDGEARIREAVIAHIGGNVRGGLPIGHAVYFFRLPEVINSVPGVVDYELTVSADGKDFMQGNIQIGMREKAVTDAEKVVISS